MQNIDIEEIRSFRRSLRQLERETSYSLGRETECCGVTVAQCHLLLEAEMRSRASLGDLAEALALDSSTLSRTVDGLAGLGFLSRVQDPADRRKIAIDLTDEGRVKAASINDECDRLYRAVLLDIPGEKRSGVVESIGILAGALRARRASAARRSCACRNGGAS